MATLNDLMVASTREIVARARIVYLNPLFSDSFSYNTIEHDPVSNPNDLINGRYEPEYKWISFGANVLDGSYHFPPTEPSPFHTIGVWDSDVSSGTGATSHIFNSNFNKLDVVKFNLVGDSKVEIYPVDFNINFYNEFDTLIAQEVVLGNEEVVYSFEKVVSDVARIEVTISRINKANTKSRIVEASILTVDFYTKTEIINLSILDEIQFESSGVPIGTISANEVMLDLINIDNRFDINNTDTVVQTLLKRGRKITIDFGVNDSGVFVWRRAGIFYSSNWEISPDELMVSTTGLDRLELLRTTEYRKGVVTYGQSLYDLFEDILIDTGLPYYKYNIDSSLNLINLPFCWFGKMSHRLAIQRLGKVALLDIFIDKSGVIQIRPIIDSGESVFTFDDNNVFKRTYPSGFQEEINKVEVQSNNYTEIATAKELLFYNSPFTLMAGETKTMELSYQRDDITEVTSIDMTKDDNINITNQTEYCWGIILTFTNSSSVSNATLTDLKINGKYLVLDYTEIAKTENIKSQTQNGMNKTNYDFELVQGISAAQQLSDDLFNLLKFNRFNIQLDCRGHIGLELGDVFKYYDSKYDAYNTYTLTRQTLDWDGALSSTVEARRIE